MRPENVRQELSESLRHPPLAPVLEELRKKFVDSLKPPGELPAGSITMQSDEEADALGGLIRNRRLKKGSKVRIRDIDRLLKENTRFLGLRDALEVHFGAFVSRGEARFERTGAERATFTRLLEAAYDPSCTPLHLRDEVVTWIDADRQVLHKRARQGILAVEHDLRGVIRALARLPERGSFVILSGLAYEATGNAHAFDAGRSAGVLLDRVLLRRHPELASETRRGARWRRRLLAAARIAPDEISSKVDTFGILGDSPHWEEEAATGQDCSFTLRKLSRCGPLRARYNFVFVVENPQVFAAILSLFESANLPGIPTIVCTNGWFNVADEILLETLVQSGARLLYSGDFDPDGLRIAAELMERHPGKVDLWRFTPVDYQIAVRDFSKPLRGSFSDRIRNLMPDLTKAMLEVGRAASQEALVENLFSDIAGVVRSRAMSSGSLRSPAPAR